MRRKPRLNVEICECSPSNPPTAGVERVRRRHSRRCSRRRVLRVRIVVYRRQMSEILEIKARKLYAEAESAILSFQFPTNDAERTSVEARRRRSRVLRVRILL